jgi:hypothetical protein
MPEMEFRIFFDNTGATDEQLELIDEITVEQEVDMAWEARLKIPVYVDDEGNWCNGDEEFMRPFTRVRVEIKIGDEDFTPLFDGPITGFDSKMNSGPGDSHLTLIAQDDTFFLNRVENIAAFEDRADHEVAEQLFDEYSHLVASKEIDTTPASGTALTPLVVQRGTAMQLLRSLAKRQGLHAYVLPGDEPGETIGCFKAFPIETDGLPPLILLGAECNVEAIDVHYCACKPSDAKASTLKITDKSITEETVNATDAELMGDETAEESSEADMQILPPHQGESVDLNTAVTAVVQNASYSYEVTGQLLEDTYTGVLSPYRVVSLQAGNTPVSGDYLITKISHKITAENYTQSFTMKRNARSTPFGSGSPGVPGGIF